VDSLPLALLACHLVGFYGAQCKKKLRPAQIDGRPTLKEKKVMRKNAIRLVLVTILMIGVNSATCKAQGPVPPQWPPMGVK
jgi:hypothetical protein